MARSSSASVLALVTPTDEPMLDGFTNSGSPSWSAIAVGVWGETSCSRKASHRAWSMPCWASTCLAIALSMASAEPSTPAPT